jgi:hypothetical protein
MYELTDRELDFVAAGTGCEPQPKPCCGENNSVTNSGTNNGNINSPGGIAIGNGNSVCLSL